MVRKRFSTRLLALIAVATLPAASVFAAEAEIPQTVLTADTTVFAAEAEIPQTVPTADTTVFAAEAEIPQTVPTADTTVVQWVDNSGDTVLAPVTDVIANKEQGIEGEKDVITSEPTDGDGLGPAGNEDMTPTAEQATEAPAVDDGSIIEEPVAATATVIIVQRLSIGSKTMEYTETIDDLEAGTQLDLTNYIVESDNIKCISEVTSVVVEDGIQVILEYCDLDN